MPSSSVRRTLHRRPRPVSVAVSLGLLLATGCAASAPSSSTAGPNPTAEDPGPNPTTADPGPNPTTPSTTRTVVGTVQVRGRCATIAVDGHDYELVVTPPFAVGTDGLERDGAVVAPAGSRIVVSASDGPVGPCGPTLRMDHLVSVLPR